MKILKSFFVLAVMSMIIMSPSTAFATDNSEMSTSTTDNLIVSDNNEVHKEFANYTYDLNSYNDLLVNYDNSAFGSLLWEVPNDTEKTGLLNAEYNTLKTDLSLLGYGKGHELLYPDTFDGYSKNVVDMFSDAFGSTDNTLSQMSMPDGWSVQEIINSAQANREATLGDYKNSTAYQVISNTLSTSSIFKTASQTLYMPESGSIADCAANLAGFTSPFGTANDLKSNSQSKYNSSKSQLSTKDAKSAYDEYLSTANNFNMNPIEVIKTEKIVNDSDAEVANGVNDVITGTKQWNNSVWSIVDMPVDNRDIDKVYDNLSEDNLYGYILSCSETGGVTVNEMYSYFDIDPSDGLDDNEIHQINTFENAEERLIQSGQMDYSDKELFRDYSLTGDSSMNMLFHQKRYMSDPFSQLNQNIDTIMDEK